MSCIRDPMCQVGTAEHSVYYGYSRACCWRFTNALILNFVYFGWSTSFQRNVFLEIGLGSHVRDVLFLAYFCASFS